MVIMIYDLNLDYFHHDFGLKNLRGLNLLIY